MHYEKNYLDKIIKPKTKKAKQPKKVKKAKQRLPKINLNPKIAKEKCPTGMYYNKEYAICEIDAINPKELKKAKNKTYKKKKQPKKKINNKKTIEVSMVFCKP